ncbi:hypothetical protein BHE74_00055942, partial [Ensete ventricosum]
MGEQVCTLRDSCRRPLQQDHKRQMVLELPEGRERLDQCSANSSRRCSVVRHAIKEKNAKNAVLQMFSFDEIVVVELESAMAGSCTKKTTTMSTAQVVFCKTLVDEVVGVEVEDAVAGFVTKKTTARATGSAAVSAEGSPEVPEGRSGVKKRVVSKIYCLSAGSSETLGRRGTWSNRRHCVYGNVCRAGDHWCQCCRSVGGAGDRGGGRGLRWRLPISVLCYFRLSHHRVIGNRHRTMAAASATTAEVKLLGLWLSPFVTKVGIALNLKKVGYELVQVEIHGQKSEILVKSNPVYKKIPVLIHQGKPICESAIIVEYIDEIWTSEPPILPSHPFDRAVARFWATYI